MLTWEALTAVATLLSTLVIAATVMIGMRQVRLTGDQLRHLRQSTQLAGTMAIFDRLNAPDFSDARRFVMHDLERCMQDADFRRDVPLIGFTDLSVHREVIVLRAFEQLGVYVKHGLLDGEIIYDYYAPPITNAWENLRDAGVIDIHRRAQGVSLWENFELLYRRTTEWVREHGDGIQTVRQWDRDRNEVVADAPRS